MLDPWKPEPPDAKIVGRCLAAFLVILICITLLKVVPLFYLLFRNLL
jgi:hypothetical protein